MAILEMAISARGIIDQAEKAKRALEGVGSTAKSTFNVLSKSVSITLAPLEALIGLAATTKASMLGIGAASLNAAASYQTFNQQLRAVLATKKQADAAFSESIDFSMGTPFEPKQIIETRIALESVGVKGTKAVESVASAAAAMNKDILAVASSVSSLETEPLRNLGISLERSGSQFVFGFRDKVGQAESIAVKGFENAQNALLSIFDDKFGGSLEKMSVTYNGLISTLKGGVTDLRSTFGNGLLDEGSLIVDDMIKGIGSLKESAKAAGVAFGDEIMTARASILASFDVARQMASQISEVMKLDGGSGQVILEAFRFGSDLVGTAIGTAFELSIPIWRTIASILGQGVIDAFYSSNLPGAGHYRSSAIEKNLEGYSDSKLAQTPSAKYLFGGMQADDNWQGKLSEENRVKIVGWETERISELPINEQTNFAHPDSSGSINKSIEQFKTDFPATMQAAGISVTNSLQEFENNIAKQAGQSPFDIDSAYKSSYDKRMVEGESRKEQIQKLLDSENPASKVATPPIVARPTEQVMSSNSGVKQMFETLELEKSLIGKTNDERERAIEMTRLQTEVAKEYGATSIEEIADIEKRTAATKELTAVQREYSESLEGLQRSREFQSFSDSVGVSAANSFGDMVRGAKSAKEAFADLGNQLVDLVFQFTVLRPLAMAISSTMMGGMGGMGFFAKGGVFENGRVTAFAGGGIVSKPTLFPMANGAGLMGEAGPEAIMPLRRGRDGRLGVSSGSESSSPVIQNHVNVVNNSSQPVNAKTGETTFDGKKYVTSIILEDMASNGVIARTMKQGR